jgi:hypothetical protein
MRRSSSCGRLPMLFNSALLWCWYLLKIQWFRWCNKVLYSLYAFIALSFDILHLWRQRMCGNGSWHTYGMCSVLPLEPGVTPRRTTDCDELRRRWETSAVLAAIPWAPRSPRTPRILVDHSGESSRARSRRIQDPTPAALIPPSTNLSLTCADCLDFRDEGMEREHVSVRWVFMPRPRLPRSWRLWQRPPWSAQLAPVVDEDGAGQVGPGSKIASTSLCADKVTRSDCGAGPACQCPSSE